LMWKWKNQRRLRTRRNRLWSLYRLEAHTYFGRDNMYYMI
jgi:hypothetical protein